MMIEHEQLRLLPSVDELLHTVIGQQLGADFSRALTVEAFRTAIAQARIAIRAGAACPTY